MAATKKKNGQVFDPLSFPLDTRMTIPHRIASALHYLAEHYPGSIFSWSVIYQTIHGQSVLPRNNNREVELLKSRANAVKRILHEHYNCGYISVTGVGVRASFDDADRARFCGAKAIRGLEKKAESVQRELNSVNIKNIPDRPENTKIRNWMQNHAKKTLEATNELLKHTLLLTSKSESDSSEPR